jgi:hypothetical protein
VSEQSNLLRVGDTLLYLLNGTWRSVHRYFHGVPFILSGSAVALSRRYPAWLGWVGVAGGTASFSGRREGDRAALAVVGNGATVGLGGRLPELSRPGSQELGTRLLRDQPGAAGAHQEKV